MGVMAWDEHPVGPSVRGFALWIVVPPPPSSPTTTEVPPIRKLPNSGLDPFLFAAILTFITRSRRFLPPARYTGSRCAVRSEREYEVLTAESRKAADGLGVTPQGGRAEMRPIELGGLSPGWSDADAASVGVGWLVGDWLSSKLGRGIWVPPCEDTFVPSVWAG